MNASTTKGKASRLTKFFTYMYPNICWCVYVRHCNHSNGFFHLESQNSLLFTTTNDDYFNDEGAVGFVILVTRMSG